MSDEKEMVEILLKPNGSLRVTGKVILIDETGERIEKEGPFSLCRCGASKNKPFCDGRHREIQFDSKV